MRTFGKDLRKWLHDARGAWNILPGDWPTWLQGGCWLLAQALHEWIGGPSELWAIYSEVGSDVLRPDVIPQHVVVRIGDCYLDGDGASNEGELLERWEKVEQLRYPELRPANVKELEELMIECPVGPKMDLVRALEERFGSWLRT